MDRRLGRQKRRTQFDVDENVTSCIRLDRYFYIYICFSYLVQKMSEDELIRIRR